MFTLQSFGRVIRRHERDAILQHPAAWDPLYRAELQASRAFAKGRSGRGISPVSVVSRVPRRPLRDPFEDMPPMPATRDSRVYTERSVNSVEVAQRGLSPPVQRVRPWISDRQSSLSSTGSYELSAADVPLHPDPLYSHMLWDSTAALPSPGSTHYPPSITRSSLRSESPHSDSRGLVHSSNLAGESSLRSSRHPSSSSVSPIVHWKLPSAPVD